jgi:hypothetical protein
VDDVSRDFAEIEEENSTIDEKKKSAPRFESIIESGYQLDRLMAKETEEYSVGSINKSYIPDSLLIQGLSIR